ncbi:basic amino acid ABC transporter substrate-binding protein [Halopelagius longus]|uniref:Amino acid ABC transporter substrate-binding protein, PAAT family n=1 Tax=Halopelagius longus TaxID=1236180 RepID=A0A1H0YPG2_9EURY|nr:basic amino acid ABC transporter substrate-binding protein [Halopelagius longus]RDI72606.1 basic amino acid ABC transporter substrate-binding protein [Halopelagius longus]SDQ17045.1 amino acid ABC transporter substrate-binding protein, PAAT family [Halopelagius longus]
MDRRTYLKTGTGAVVGTLLAGCTGGGSGGGEGETTEGAGEETTGAETTAGEETTTGESESLPETVVIGSDIPYRPFEYETTSGELTGFDVDIAKAIFEGELGIGYEFKPTSFDSIIPSLNNNNFRIIMSAMTINEERAKKVDFSDPYFTAYQTVIVRKDSDITSKEDLKGKNVGVQKGTTGASAAEGLKEEFGGDLTLKKFDQIPGAFQALMNGQVDAVVNDNTVNAEFVNGKGEGKVRFLEGEGEAAEQGKDAPPYLTLTVEEYGIAFRKDDDEFRKKVNEALAAIRESGKYDEIYSQYFQG